MLLQKLFCIAALIVCAAIFVYSLGIMTDIYDLIRGKNNIGNEADPYNTTVSGSWIYYEMQPFNRQFTAYSIVMILLAVFLFITNTHIRRRYYFANFLSTGLYAAGSAAFTLWAHNQIEFYRSEFLKIDFEALKAVADKMKGYYTESTFWFDLHLVVFALLIISALALIFNLCFKLYLMRSEKKLLAAGKETAK